MPMLIPEEVRAKAEIYTGDAEGQEKTRLMLAETELPSGLLPLKDIIECGYVEETGFMWLKQKKKVDHYFAKVGRYVSYAAEVSAYAEKGRLKKITGVKAKEMLIWVTLNEICLDDPPTAGKKEMLICKAMGGLFRSFPVEAFQADDDRPVPVTGRLKKKTETESKEGQDHKKLEEKKEEAVAATEEKAAEKEKKTAAVAPAVDEIDLKMKEMNKEAPAVQAEAVAAKN